MYNLYSSHTFVFESALKHLYKRYMYDNKSYFTWTNTINVMVPSLTLTYVGTRRVYTSLIVPGTRSRGGCTFIDVLVTLTSGPAWLTLAPGYRVTSTRSRSTVTRCGTVISVVECITCCVYRKCDGNGKPNLRCKKRNSSSNSLWIRDRVVNVFRFETVCPSPMWFESHMRGRLADNGRLLIHSKK